MRWTYPRTGLLALAAVLTVTACSGGDGEQDDGAFETDVASDAAEYTLDLLSGVGGNRPGSILGAYVTAFLMAEAQAPYRTAIMGIDAQVRIRIPDDETDNETYALLQDLGAALQVDIMDLLNRSTDRAETLTEYLDALETFTNRGIERQAQLEEELDTLVADRREKRKVVARLRSEQSRALREQDFTTAGDKQRELIDAEQELSMVELEAGQVEDAAGLFDDLIEVSRERWSAITANRAIILAGLEVVEVPGIDELGVIREETRQQRLDRENQADDAFSDPL